MFMQQIIKKVLSDLLLFYTILKLHVIFILKKKLLKSKKKKKEKKD